MWQITWMLSFVPDWIWILFLIAGVLAYFASRFLAAYRLPLILGGAAAVILSTWMLGAASNEAKWDARVKELEDKVAAAEAESKKENVVIQEKIIYKDKIIKEKGKTQLEYIDRIVKGDTEIIVKDMSDVEREAFKKKQAELEYSLKMCPVPQIIIEEHNKAALKEINDAAKGVKK
jgi:hypothetical protein